MSRTSSVAAVCFSNTRVVAAGVWGVVWMSHYLFGSLLAPAWSPIPNTHIHTRPLLLPMHPQREGNVLMSFNNRPATDSIPFLSPFLAPSARAVGPLLEQLATSPFRLVKQPGCQPLCDTETAATAMRHAFSCHVSIQPDDSLAALCTSALGRNLASQTNPCQVLASPVLCLWTD